MPKSAFAAWIELGVHRLLVVRSSGGPLRFQPFGVYCHAN